MQNLTLTLKNFRCFDDSHPAVLQLKPGVTALVGPNNAGKSSLLRMFFELRGLFGLLNDPNTIVQWLRGQSVHVPIAETPDPSVLLSDENDRPMSLRIECAEIRDTTSVKAAQFTFPRQSPSNVAATFFVGPNQVPAPITDNAKQTALGQFRVGDGHIQMSELQSEALLLAKTLYIGPFRNVLNQGASQYYDLTIGTAFVQMWDQWKNGDSRSNNHAIKRVENAIGHLFGYDRLEINPSSNRTRLRVFINGQSFDLQDQGSGLAQFVLAFGSAATRQPSIILIDEPESNLHPSLQIDFLATLGTFASDGVLFSTHSIGLARSVAEQIYSLQRRGSRTILRQYDETPNLIEFAGEMSFSAFREFGYDRLLLVEGPTDVRTVQQFLRKLGKDRRIVIFPLLGHAFASGAHPEALIELTRIAAPEQITALVDSERPALNQPAHPRRVAFKNACEGLGISVHLTERRAIENYFTQTAIHNAVGEQYEALQPYEEHGLKPKNWSKALNWKIAHAMTLEELHGTDLFAVLEGL